ncbi:MULTISPECIES: precorrin-3B synthase [Actinokineospora]|uniref:Precorrin-3B synthase n=1 Tax=Actinokineospora fastidiosa TaxID=1816 RepID=A0A918LD56_9PSEU|nr:MULTISPECIES: precorrin-3B synthase [Actinokineospora]UVS79942.1 ferredoxin-nitrite reductase [Actinokineospora sp. UTMC 2448]GGS31939.1 precorrin-3B synthase [Actinokineospora fastidiosa]
MSHQNRRSGADACPGALDVHQAADGGLARVRLPGGRITSAQLSVLAAAARELGSGGLELTSRANVQIRGLGPRGPAELGARLAAAGLLPSISHEKVRNIMSSPPGDHGAAALDAALCADPALAALPGRFLFALDSGAGDVAWLGADVAALPVGARFAILLGGEDHGVRVCDPVEAMLAAARAFLEIRDGQWRMAELGPDVAKIADRLGTSPERVPRGRPPTGGPLGRIGDAVGAAVPLGRLDDRQLAVLIKAEHVVITPWRGVVVPRGSVAELTAVGLVVDPAAAGIGVTACTGAPGCAKSLADVRADALRITRSGRPVHFAGCARRCGRPAGDVVDVVAVDGGYEVDGRWVSGGAVAGAAAEARQEQR